MLSVATTHAVFSGVSLSHNLPNDYLKTHSFLVLAIFITYPTAIRAIFTTTSINVSIMRLTAHRSPPATSLHIAAQRTHTRFQLRRNAKKTKQARESFQDDVGSTQSTQTRMTETNRSTQPNVIYQSSAAPGHRIQEHRISNLLSE